MTLLDVNLYTGFILIGDREEQLTLICTLHVAAQLYIHSSMYVHYQYLELLLELLL